MEIISGKTVCGGVSFGRIHLFKRSSKLIRRQHIENTSAEYHRYIEARNRASSELDELFDKAVKEIGEAEAQIFDIHKMMLEDMDFNESVKNTIETQKLNAEAAVFTTAETFSTMFSQMEDAYMQARAADVKDVSDRIISILNGDERHEISSEEPLIIFADDLAPSETLQMDKDKIAAFVTERGSANSHTAILARSMGIPAIIGAENLSSPELDGKLAAVDGYTGTVYIEPDEDTTSELNKKRQARDAQQELLKELKDKPSETIDGRQIKLYANIGTTGELGSVLLNDAEGVGLFRSEFLYLGREDFPSEDVQFDAYKKVCEGLAGKPVIIRTLDVGADKQIDYLKLADEENPAMGMRAIRICLTHTDIFKTQLRAILRASAFGNILIMLPMIVSPEEIRSAKEILAEARAELMAEGIPFDRDIPVGIMIETPAAAMISDILARESDFFSIGTNDLTQYMLAMDRQNESVANMMDPHHEAILRTIAMVIENAHKNGIWVGICGELGSDTELIPRFLKMGIDELSVTPNKVLEVRKVIRENYSK